MLQDGGKPFLRLMTFKKRFGPRERLVPIDELDLNALLDFIEIYRAPLVARAGRDCGFLLLSLRGTKLKPNSLTLEMYQLRKAAGIEGKAHGHLFRHRYISKKLRSLIREENFQTRDSDETGYVVTASKPGMPLPIWPNGRWCFEVAYFLNAGSSPLSSSDRGGSYGAIAYALGPLIRFCARNRIGFLEMSDSQFTLFMHGLAAKEEFSDGTVGRIRENNRIITIGRQSLAFLYSIASFYGHENFVGDDGRPCFHSKYTPTSTSYPSSGWVGRIRVPYL